MLFVLLNVCVVCGCLCMRSFVRVDCLRLFFFCFACVAMRVCLLLCVRVLVCLTACVYAGLCD